MYFCITKIALGPRSTRHAVIVYPYFVLQVRPAEFTGNHIQGEIEYIRGNIENEFDCDVSCSRVTILDN